MTAQVPNVKDANYRLRQITLTEQEIGTGLRIKEYVVWSFFEADRKLEALKAAQHGVGSEVRFDIQYQKNSKPLNYKGRLALNAMGESISLQRHIETFLRHHQANPSALGLSEQHFQQLQANMMGLFEVCLTEQMFSLNRQPHFQTKA